MTKIKFIKSFLILCLFFVLLGISTASANAAAKLYFDPTNQNAVIGQDFQVKLNIDVGTVPVFGSDALVTLPSGSDLIVKSVTKGDFFTDFGFSQSGSDLKIFGYFATPFQNKSGAGNFATITFTSNRAAGTNVIAFSCPTNGRDTDIVDSNGNNILTCDPNMQVKLTYSTAATPTPTPGSSGGSNNGPTNACGGTCGSIYNCNTNLFCYQGFCRNPNCPNDLTCGCVATPTPTPKPKAKATLVPLASATPEVVTLAKATPYPSSTPLAGTPAASVAQASQGFGYLLWISGIAFALAVILMIFAL